jgi:NADH-quinone oxidoreductase subunit L
VSPLLAVEETLRGAAVAGEGILATLWVPIALPLLGAAVLLLAGRRSNAWGHLLATGLAAVSFLFALAQVVALAGRPEGERAVSQTLFSFIPVTDLDVDWGLLLDPLSAVFVLLITGVGTLVHVYSIGYMEHDPERRRFFAYLNLFLASMLLLVLGDSFLTLYVGWEAVGLASYLLIGFWSYKPEAATAAKKAFIANRVGDAGLLIAIFLLFITFGSTEYAEIFPAADELGLGVATALGLLLLLGACGKSAQFPLHVWLPDAMEGPTPASALIHAATMVTAGVYLIARAAPIFDVSEPARTTVAIVGVITILVGAVIGCAVDDIKRVLAYSTVSQIGYMILAVGLGPAGYALGIFHLLTHGFFKALLFMGAGSVMHGMGDRVDMRGFGGLLKPMPWTGGLFLVGWLAIIGFPLTSGFFSKEAIIEAAIDQNLWLGLAALAGAALTAFYMTRLVAMTFFGSPRYDTAEIHPHEAPPVMIVPMAVLAVGALVAGFVLEPVLGFTVFDLEHWLAPVVGEPEEAAHRVSPLLLTVFVVAISAGAVAVAFTRYVGRPVPAVAPGRVNPLTRAARNKLYGDAFYEGALMRPGQYLTRALVYLEGRGIDGGVNGVAALIGGSSGRLRRLQTGFVRSYALTLLGGAVLVAVSLLSVRLG